MSIYTINKKFSICLFVILFFTFFSFSFISASSVIAPVPDICLPKNVSFYDIWLEDYYSIDVDETIEIRYIDPINGYLLDLPENHMTLNLECWEMGYYFDVRNPGELTTDLIRIQTLDDDCTFSPLIMFDSDDTLDQSFTVTVSDSCNETPYEAPDPVFNFSSSLFTNLIAYYPFDDDLDDHYGSYDMASIGSLSFNDSGFSGGSLSSSASFPVSLFSNISSDGIFSLSFWYSTYIDWLSFSQIWSCDNRDKEVSSFAGWRSLAPYLNGSTANYTGHSPSVTDGPYRHVVVVFDGSAVHTYVNTTYGSAQLFENDGVVNNCSLNYPSSGSGIFFDDFAVFDKVLNSTEIDLLYNSGSGYDFSQINNTPSQTSIVDIYLNSSVTEVSINLSEYLSDWEDIYILSPDPWNDYEYRIYTGYSTLNTDFYEIKLYTNGTLKVSSYERPYDFSLEVYACHYDPSESCTTPQTIDVYINKDLGAVSQLNPIQAYYDLGFSGSQLFAGNYFFQYYNTIVFSFPESNFTGVLNSTFPYQYTTLENPSNNASYMVFLSCNISQSNSFYYYLGDLNITMECGDYQSYYTLTAYNNYNQVVYLTAYNGNNSASDYTTILAGNPDLPTGYYPQLGEVTSDTDFWDDHIEPFADILPDGLNSSQKMKTFFLIFFVLVSVTFLLLFRISIPLAMYTTISVGIFVMFFFSSQGYINQSWPVLLFVGFMLFFVIKFFKGGS